MLHRHCLRSSYWNTVLCYESIWKKNNYISVTHLILDKEWLNHQFPGAASELLLLYYKGSIMVAIFCTMSGFIFGGNSSKQINFKIAFSSEVVNLQENAASKGNRLGILRETESWSLTVFATFCRNIGGKWNFQQTAKHTNFAFKVGALRLGIKKKNWTW